MPHPLSSASNHPKILKRKPINNNTNKINDMPAPVGRKVVPVCKNGYSIENKLFRGFKEPFSMRKGHFCTPMEHAKKGTEVVKRKKGRKINIY